MSREKKFHELIEAQDREEKDRVWKRIEAMEAERLAKKAVENPAVAPQKPTYWKIWTAVGGVAVACAITLSIVLPLALTPKSPEDEFRFCSDADYNIVQVETTIKDYGLETNKNFLYFDWYEVTDYCYNEQYKLKETNEIVCIRETIVDINTGYSVDIYITDTQTEVDILKGDKLDNINEQIEGVQVGWFYRTEKAYANFEYNGYIYYLRIIDIKEKNKKDILNLVAELLPDA